MASIVIRPMQPSDARAYLTVHRDSIRGLAAADYPQEVIEQWAPRISEEAIAALNDNPDDEIRIVAEFDGEIAGIGAVVLDLSQLRACYVSPKVARKGMGARIVQELEGIARANGVSRFELIATITAERFYQYLGYSSDERIRHVTSTGVEMDAVRMSKSL